MASNKLYAQSDYIPYWVEMIEDLVQGLGYSYPEIARRIRTSPSAVQRLINDFECKPHRLVFYNLASFYLKAFHSENRLPEAEQYLYVKEQYRLVAMSLCDIEGKDEHL